MNEIGNRIREMGGDVRKRVTMDVDFVIFTEMRQGVREDAYENYNTAVLMEIPIARAAEILRFLGD